MSGPQRSSHARAPGRRRTSVVGRDLRNVVSAGGGGRRVAVAVVALVAADFGTHVDLFERGREPSHLSLLERAAKKENYPSAPTWSTTRSVRGTTVFDVI